MKNETANKDRSEMESEKGIMRWSITFRYTPN